MSTSNGKGLRFAPLVRVSTEKQEKQGESLNTQRKSNERDVLVLGGIIVGWYGGQEHGTPGWERKEVDRLIRDAKKGIFDAVIVAYADRWSRDNAKSKEGLEAFRQHGIRFFVGTMEMDLFDPHHRFILGMNAEVGEFIALQQAKKSLESRIERAQGGQPTCGLLPFGRTFDEKSKTWGVDPGKQVLIQDVASRYLAGESLPRIAKEYAMNHSYLLQVLTCRSGEEWLQEFESKKLNIHETVITKVPRLLPEATITAIRIRAEVNKTKNHTQTKHPYLLSRFVLCGNCGSAMSVQNNRHGVRYFRHYKGAQGSCRCPSKGKWVRADALEDAVLRDLFGLFGNPEAVQKAMENAVPNRDKVDEYRERLVRINTTLEEVAAGRDRIIRLIAKGTITEQQAEKQLEELKTRQQEFTQEVQRLNASLENVPTAEEIKQMAQKVGRRKVDMGLWAEIMDVNTDYQRMTVEQKRSLVELVFSGRTAEGKRLGVHVTPADGKWCDYRILGHLTDQPGTASGEPFPEEEEFLGGPRQGRLLGGVSQFAQYRPSKPAYYPFALAGCTRPVDSVA